MNDTCGLPPGIDLSQQPCDKVAIGGWNLQSNVRWERCSRWVIDAGADGNRRSCLLSLPSE